MILLLYSWSEFGREAEFVVALYLKNKGWQLELSKASRGPADIIAWKSNEKWLIQVKASSKIPRLRGYEVKRLYEMASLNGGKAVVSTLQPSVVFNNSEKGGYAVGKYAILFYSLLDWKILEP